MFSFPHPVNEKAARVVAAVVFALGLLTLLTGWDWLLAVLAYGFWARLLTGPTLSPLGRFASSVAGPRLGQPKHVPGPPKRFAQGIGAALTTTAALAALAFGAPGLADALLIDLLVAAGLEAFLAFCLGCHAFSALMRLGLIPASVCADCNDIWSRPEMAR